jgi:hypothetical protein|tara:strand:+ start:207 stop:428 length:222 start_codon:yes stop_codon:yes gene_type:complete
MACIKQVKTEYNVDELILDRNEATRRVNRLSSLTPVADGNSGILVVETVYSSAAIEEELAVIQNKISRLEDLQ